MPFCEQCGNPLSATARFCGACGRAVADAGGAPVSAAAPATRRWLTLRAAAAGLLVMATCLGVATAYYLSHRLTAATAQITQAVPQVGSIMQALPVAQSLVAATTSAPGVPSDAASSSAGLDSNRSVAARDGQCALFTKEELTRVLGDEFTHADGDATGCTYKGDAPRQMVRTEARWKGGHELVKEKSDAYAAMRQSMLNQHYSKTDIDAHVFPISRYAEVGDEAWVDLVNIVTARKGDAGIVLDLRYYHDSDDLTRMMTNAALSRLQDK
jgi:hypothetical protein